jgi:hypothetical protein
MTLSITTLGINSECHHAECSYAECCYAECRGTVVEQLVRNPEIGDLNPASGNGRDNFPFVSSVTSGSI